MRWGGNSQALPLKVLEGLATTMALAAEEWRPPAWDTSLWAPVDKPEVFSL